MSVQRRNPSRYLVPQARLVQRDRKVRKAPVVPLDLQVHPDPAESAARVAAAREVKAAAKEAKEAKAAAREARVAAREARVAAREAKVAARVERARARVEVASWHTMPAMSIVPPVSNQ